MFFFTTCTQKIEKVQISSRVTFASIKAKVKKNTKKNVFFSRFFTLFFCFLPWSQVNANFLDRLYSKLPPPQGQPVFSTYYDASEGFGWAQSARKIFSIIYTVSSTGIWNLGTQKLFSSTRIWNPGTQNFFQHQDFEIPAPRIFFPVPGFEIPIPGIFKYGSPQ